MVNKLILQGRLTRDPELKSTQSGVEYLEFTVAWSEKYKETETKCFMRCKAWRHNAKFIADYFHKGQEIVVEGRMVTESWQDNGQDKSRTICMVEKVNFCGSAKGSGNNNTTDAFVNNVPDIDAEELPFS